MWTGHYWEWNQPWISPKSFCTNSEFLLLGDQFLSTLNHENLWQCTGIKKYLTNLEWPFDVHNKTDSFCSAPKISHCRWLANLLAHITIHKVICLFNPSLSTKSKNPHCDFQASVIHAACEQVMPCISTSFMLCVCSWEAFNVLFVSHTRYGKRTSKVFDKHFHLSWNRFSHLGLVCVPYALRLWQQLV